LIGTQHGLGGEVALWITTEHKKRMGTGAMPAWDHRAVPVAISTDRAMPPSQETVCVCHTGAGSVRRVARVGWRVPFTAGRPFLPVSRAGAGSDNAASRRRRVTSVTCGKRTTFARNSTTAEPHQRP
jgi:hypothetical protein